MRVLIAGGGIGGLALALSLHDAGITDVQVVEPALRIAPLGVGINLPPHATRELSELGLADALADLGVPTSELAYYDSSGALLSSEPRGSAAGYRWPQYSVHRGRLQLLLLETVRQRLGAERVRTGHAVTGLLGNDAGGVAVGIRNRESGTESRWDADILIGADGIRSTVRTALFPDKGPLAWNGWVMWRGVTQGEPFLSGSSMVIAGDDRQRVVAYPISPRADERGRVTINWILSREAAEAGPDLGDWNKAVGGEVLRPLVDGWRFDWLDIPALIRDADVVYEYPMVDLEPLPQWTVGRATLLGDAAHAMYPFGSNGASQAILDARVLAYELATRTDADAALRAYEARRRPTATEVQRANRRQSREVMQQVSALARRQDAASAAEILDTAEQAYRRAAGFDVDTLNNRASLGVSRS